MPCFFSIIGDRYAGVRENMASRCKSVAIGWGARASGVRWRGTEGHSFIDLKLEYLAVLA